MPGVDLEDGCGGGHRMALAADEDNPAAPVTAALSIRGSIRGPGRMHSAVGKASTSTTW